MYVSSERPWFSFLVHPRDLRDLDSIRAASLLRRYSSDEADYVAKATTLPALVLGDVRVQGVVVKGEIICAVRMPDQVMQADGMRTVVEAAQLATQRGAAIIGLGALTAPAMGGGVRLLRHLPPTVKVTNGNGYTAAVARSNVHEAAQFLGLGTSARVAVLGATGSVGGAASWLLADDGFPLVLIGRTVARVRHLLGDLADRADFADDLDVLKTADIVLCLTHERGARLIPEMLRPGSVVIDVAAPYNVEPARRAEFARYGVPVAKGALVRIPGHSCAQDFAMPGPEDTFACLAETYLLSREGLFQNSVGRPTADYAREIEQLAARYGVYPRPITPDLIKFTGPDPDGAGTYTRTPDPEE